jgi:hypothetical protein
MTERRGAAHWVGLAVGGAVIAYGAYGLVVHTSMSALHQVVNWVVGADLIHDLVVAPIVCIIGLAALRLTPQVWRWPLRAGLVTSALVVAVAYPALRGFGRHRAPNNRSILPLDYPTAVATVLGVVWTLVIIWGVVATRQANMTRQPSRLPNGSDQTRDGPRPGSA